MAYLKKLPLLLLILLLTGALTIACSRADNRETKKEILNKDDKAVGAEGRRKPLPEIDLAKVPGDLQELEKLLLMTQEDIFRRLHSYRFDARVAYSTIRKEGSITLEERQEFSQAANGDFHLRTFNDKGNHYELYYLDGACHDRSDQGEFRVQKIQGKHLFWREKIYAALDRFYKYFRGHLLFSGPERTSFEGRKALKYSFSLDPNGKTPEQDLPTTYNFPNQYAMNALAVDKLVNKNRKRVNRFEEGRGYILVDEESKAVVGWELKGRYAVPLAAEPAKALQEKGLVAEKGQEVVFGMEADYHAKEIGQAISISVPGPSAEAPKRDKPPAELAPLLPPGAKVNAPSVDGDPEKGEGRETEGEE